MTFSINREGDYRMETEDLSPKTDLGIAHQTLGNSGLIPTRSIYESGKLTLYTQDWKQVQVTEIQAVDLSAIVALLTDSTMDDAAVTNLLTSSLLTRPYSTDVDERLFGDQLKSRGPLGGQVVVRTEFFEPGEYPEAEGGKIIFRIDGNTSLLLSTAVFDRSDLLIEEVAYNYTQASADAAVQLRSSVERYLRPLPSGQIVIVSEETRYEDIHITL